MAGFGVLLRTEKCSRQSRQDGARATERCETTSRRPLLALQTSTRSLFTSLPLSRLTFHEKTHQDTLRLRRFDDLMATLPVPPLPPGLPPNLLDAPEPDFESIPSASSSSLSSKSKKKLDKGKGNESATAAESTSAERLDPDVGGDGRSDWSLEALEAYLVSQLRIIHWLVDSEGMH